MATVKTWLASAALVGGAGGGVAAGLATTSDPARPTAHARPVPAAPDTGVLQREIDSLLQEDRALQRAVSRARTRLSRQVQAGEQSLAALHRRILAARAELVQVQAQGDVNELASVVVTKPAAPPVSPPAHATTGASGAGSRQGDDDGEHERGGDD